MAIVSHEDVLAYLGKNGDISDADEELVRLLHPLAESDLVGWFGHEISQNTFIEYLPMGVPEVERDELANVDVVGDRVVFSTGLQSTNALQLKHTPVITTSLEVREDIGGYAGQSSGAFGSSTVLTQGTDYWLDLDDGSNTLSRTGIIWREGALWPAEPRSVKVTYMGGFTEAQLQANPGGLLRLSALETVVANFKRAKSLQKDAGPLASESIGKYSRSVDRSALAEVGLSTDIPYSAKLRLQRLKSYGRYL